jgi:hypothetical protein
MVSHDLGTQIIVVLKLGLKELLIVTSITT